MLRLSRVMLYISRSCWQVVLIRWMLVFNEEAVLKQCTYVVVRPAFKKKGL